MNKAEIRKIKKQERREMEKNLAAEKSRQIAERVQTLAEWKQAKTVLAYLPCQNEADASILLCAALREKKTAAVPVSNPETLEMLAAELLDFSELAPGAYGILEPETVVPVAPERLDLVLVPGVAFDKNGGRIGFGKGYYDRFLKKTSAKTVALCYGFQIVPDCFSESEDYPMDYIVTEDEVIACGKGRQ